jgi:hypothetical protein
MKGIQVMKGIKMLAILFLAGIYIHRISTTYNLVEDIHKY